MALDDFTGTNGTTLTAHNANWTLTAASQSDTGNWTIQSNELQAAAFRNLYAYRSDSATDDAQLILRGNGTDARNSGPAVRMSSGSEGYACMLTVPSGGDYTRMEVRKNGSFFAQINITNSQSTDHTLRITATDNGPNVDLEVFIDTVSVWTGTDSSSPIASGNDGIYIGARNGVATVDDFVNNAVTRGITDIDSDNDVQAGQTNVTITAVGLDASPTTQTATLGGESLTVNSWSDTTVNVDIPLHIDLEWGTTTNQLALTDDTGTVTLENVTLSTPTGWETVTFTSAPDSVSTESFYEKAQTDSEVGNFTMSANDILAWESASGLTIDAQTIPIVEPAATVTGAYKIWDDSLNTWTDVSSYLINISGSFATKFRDFLDSLPGGSSTKGLIAYLQGEGFTGSLNEMFVEFLKTKSSKASHTGRYQDWENNGFN